jgi:hypothetical protein
LQKISSNLQAAAYSSCAFEMVQELIGVSKVSQEVHLEVAPQNFASSLQAIAYSARAWLFFPTR